MFSSQLELLSLSPSNHATEAFSARKKQSSVVPENDNKRLKAIIKEVNSRGINSFKFTLA